MREKLPEGFQRSEFLLDHGAIDLIVDRREMRDRIAALLAMLTRQPAAATAAAQTLGDESESGVEAEYGSRTRP